MTNPTNPEFTSENESLKQKISAHNDFCDQLKLDRNRSGGELAALIEDLAETYPTNWQEVLGEILQKALRLENDVSLQDAMFYMGDLIEALDVKKMKEAVTDDPERLQLLLGNKQGSREIMREEWRMDNRMIASGIGDDFVPEWWTTIEMQEGKYDSIIKKIGDRTINLEELAKLGKK